MEIQQLEWINNMKITRKTLETLIEQQLENHMLHEKHGLESKHLKKIKELVQTLEDDDLIEALKYLVDSNIDVKKTGKFPKNEHRISKSYLEKLIYEQLDQAGSEPTDGTIGAALALKVDEATAAVTAIVSAVEQMADDEVGQANQIRDLAGQILEDLEELKGDLE